jgi:PAS domain S-box-containing protein
MPRSRSSLQFQMPLAAALLLALLAAALTFVAVREVRNQTRDLAAARLKAGAERLATSTLNSVEQVMGRLKQLAGDPQVVAIAEGSDGNADSARAALARIVGNDDNVAVILWDLASQPRLVGAVAGDTTGWIGPPQLVDSVTFGAISTMDDSMLVYDLTAPVRRNGSLVGFVQRRARIVGTEGVGRTATTLIGEDGTLLFGSRGGAWTDMMSPVERPDYQVIGAEEPMRYQRAGVQRLGIGRQIPGTPWIVVAERPMTSIMAPTTGFMARLAIIAAVLVALTAVAAWFLARGIILPLRSLHRAVLVMREGRSDVRANVHGHPEIAEVAESFNAMAAATDQHLHQVEASEQRFRSLVTASAQIVFWLNPNGEVRDRLPGWLAFTGQTEAQAKGSGWIDAVHPDDRALALKAWSEAIHHRSLYETEYRVQRHDGEYRLCLVRGVPVLDRTGKVLEWVGTYTDITESRRTEAALHRREEELRQAQRLDAIGRLAGGVAHDFNNLLTAIVVPAELAADKLPPDHPVQLELNDIREAGTRAGELTRQLLAFGRQQVLAPVVIDLDEVVQSETRILKRVLPESVVLEFVMHGGGGKVRVDRTQLEQVIINLAVNARDAMPDGGRLTLETSKVTLTPEFCERHEGVKPGRYLQLAMTDTGHGMDEATRLQVFEPFFTTKAQGKGTGLGLSTVYGIVRQSGGHIWVYSELGKGTTVKVYFPEAVDTDAAAAQKQHPPTPVPTGTGTILFAEDEPALRRIGERVLKGLGYQVVTAENGNAAITAALQLPQIDLLVTDVVMPGMGGVELWEKLRELRPGLKVLFLSGWASDAVVRHRILEGEVPFVQKPFTAEQLGRKVHELLNT